MPLGVKNKVYDFLSKNRDREFSAEDIARALAVEKVAIIKAQLTRLMKEGKVEKTPEGLYRVK